MFISCDMCCWMASGVLKKKSCDLARLKVVLDASLKSLRMDLSLFIFLHCGGIQKHRVINKLVVGGCRL
jgi:hypothetical protein